MFVLFHSAVRSRFGEPPLTPREMKGKCTLFLLCWLLVADCRITNGLSYDYTATMECLVEPQKPQYGGGIIKNPDFNHGLEGWFAVRQGRMESRTSVEGGNKYVSVYNRTQSSDSIGQTIHLKEGNLYTLSAWVQLSEGREAVVVWFRTSTGQLRQGGRVLAKSGCWNMLKGGIFANFSGSVDLYFESTNSEVEIWIDSVSLQPFSKEQWRTHQEESIERTRKKKVRFNTTDNYGNPLIGATVSIDQIKPNFPFGCAMTKNIIENPAYQSWFSSRFTVTSFGNEMKWYSTEKQQGNEDYTIPDAMVEFAKQYGISVRGHNIFWDNPKQQPSWVKNLSPEELRIAASKRIDSIVSRYSGDVIAWDVVNENLHFSFFEDKLGPDSSSAFYSRAHELDPGATLFMNEYNTLEDSNDRVATPDKYIEKIREIQSYPGNEGVSIGIGLQSHFNPGPPNLSYMRASLDVLGATGLPLWLTEVDVPDEPNQAEYLEAILREGYSHPAVQGIIIWTGAEADGCDRMCLADSNFQNTETGDVVDRLLSGWKTSKTVTMTDHNGFFETLLFHGDYDIRITHPVTNSSTMFNLKVEKDHTQHTVHVQLLT